LQGKGQTDLTVYLSVKNVIEAFKEKREREKKTAQPVAL
jgi:hypothetical protein